MLILQEVVFPIKYSSNWKFFQGGISEVGILLTI